MERDRRRWQFNADERRPFVCPFADADKKFAIASTPDSDSNQLGKLEKQQFDYPAVAGPFPGIASAACLIRAGPGAEAQVETAAIVFDIENCA